MTNIIENKRDQLTEHAVRKIYMRSFFKLATPIIIGSGESERADIDVLLDNDFDGHTKPVIPASSIIGVFHHLFNEKSDDEPKEFRDYFFKFFGTDKSREQEIQEKAKKNPKEILQLSQSSFAVADILLENSKCEIRDGVKIDPRTNTAVTQNKYAYEVVEKADPFPIIFEITLRNGNKMEEIEYFKSFVGYFFDQIYNGHIRFGAKSNKGFGVLEPWHGYNNKYEIAELELQDKNALWQWIINRPNYKKEEININKIEELLSPPQHKYFTIEAAFQIKNSLLIKSYPAEPGEPDAVHIKRDGHYIMPGTSVMGAIRNRAWKIMNTMNLEKKEEKYYKLFGYVDAPGIYPAIPDSLKNKDKTRTKAKAQKGRVIVDETLIENYNTSFMDEIQTRIKIDRFTGGTMAGALLEEKALWQVGTDSTIVIKIKIKDYEKWEAGLMLFVLKDLVTGDLPIGGEKSIGRGVLLGKKADIKWGDGEYEKAQLKFEAVHGFVENETELGKIDIFIQAWNKEVNHGK